MIVVDAVHVSGNRVAVDSTQRWNRRKPPAGEPIRQRTVVEKHRHPVVHFLAIFVGRLCKDHTRFQMSVTVCPCFPQHGQHRRLGVHSLMKPWSLPLRCGHPFIPTISRNKAPAVFCGIAEHRLFVHGFASSIDGFSVRGFGPRGAKSPLHETKVARHVDFSMNAHFCSDRNRCLRCDVPRSFEGRKVGKWLTTHDVRQFVNRCSDGKATAHVQPSHGVLDGFHQRVDVKFCAVKGDTQVIEVGDGRIKFSKASDPLSVDDQFCTTSCKPGAFAL